MHTATSLETITKELLSYIREEYPSVCRHWFEDIQVVDISDGVLVCGVQEKVQLNYLSRCCLDQFTSAGCAVVNEQVRVEFIDQKVVPPDTHCLLYTSDAADE